MSTGFESRNVRFSITDPHANMAHDDGLLSRVSTSLIIFQERWSWFTRPYAPVVPACRVREAKQASKRPVWRLAFLGLSTS